MMDREPNLIISGLSQRVNRDGITVDVSIYRLESDSAWVLEVINDRNTSIVWDDTFATDDAAMSEFERTVVEEGMTTFLDGAQIIQFPR